MKVKIGQIEQTALFNLHLYFSFIIILTVLILFVEIQIYRLAEPIGYLRNQHKLAAETHPIFLVSSSVFQISPGSVPHHTFLANKAKSSKPSKRSVASYSLGHCSN